MVPRALRGSSGPEQHMNDGGQPRSERGPRLVDRLLAARRARFVGRNGELDLFARALAAAEPPFAVLHVVGPGGIGKTTLLREFAAVAARAGRPVVHIDARHVEPLSDHLLAALAQALGVEAGTVVALAAHWPADSVLIVDTVEAIAVLDPWLRETLLPQLPARTLVVLAGRAAPAPAWSTDIEWAPLTRALALRNLSPDDSQSYLALRGVDAARHAQALAVTHGHPLALSLVADACARSHDAAFDLGHEPDIVRTLLQKLFDEVPSAQHRLALDACATIPAMSEPALAAALGCDDAHAIFEWVASLSFIEHGPRGLFPHDLAREVLYADSRWRNPELRRTLNARLLAHLYERFQRAHGVEQQRIWFDLIYVQRYNPGLSSFYSWSEVSTVHAQPIEPCDEASILEMTARHEGAASAAIASHWLRRQPTSFLGFRDVAGSLVGYMANLRLDAVSAEDCEVDPALKPALAYMQAHGPLRAGEQAIYLRHCMACEGYQTNRATMNVVASNSSAYWTSHPTLAWNFAAVADADHFAPMFTSIHVWRAAQADFEVGGRRYGVFAHDWRAESIAQWLQAKVERASQYDAGAPAVPAAPPLLVLSQTDFVEAVRQALRDYARGDALDKNPLLRTRLLQADAAAPARAEALRALLREAVRSLEGTPKDRKLHDAIHHTYLQPAATQEQAAELLDLPFNTYRYRLARGTEHITEWLWRHEIAGS
jgi:hypothetical protein